MTTRTNASTSTDDQKLDFSAVSGSSGERSTDTVADDVFVDGKIITAENYDIAETDQALTASDGSAEGQDGDDLFIWISLFGTTATAATSSENLPHGPSFRQTITQARRFGLSAVLQ